MIRGKVSDNKSNTVNRLADILRDIFKVVRVGFGLERLHKFNNFLEVDMNKFFKVSIKVEWVFDNDMYDSFKYRVFMRVKVKKLDKKGYLVFEYFREIFTKFFKSGGGGVK